MSENPTGADNQQERLSAALRILRGHTPELRWQLPEDDMVRAAGRPAEVSGTRNDSPIPERDVTRLSEIPCRVSHIARGGSNPGQMTGSNR